MSSNGTHSKKRGIMRKLYCIAIISPTSQFFSTENCPQRDVLLFSFFFSQGFKEKELLMEEGGRPKIATQMIKVNTLCLFI